jgi:hypothetical protein
VAVVTGQTPQPLSSLARTAPAKSGPVKPVAVGFGQTFPAKKPVFAAEGPNLYKAAAARNLPFAKASLSGYQTPLTQMQEAKFRQWVTTNKIPFNPAAAKVDYDMRGFWLQQQTSGSQGRAANGHFPDTFKTPYDTTFSNQSKYAKPGTPFVWVGNTLVDKRNGSVIFKGSG